MKHLKYQHLPEFKRILDGLRERRDHQSPPYENQESTEEANEEANEDFEEENVEQILDAAIQKMVLFQMNDTLF